MLYDAGTVEICELINTAAAGAMPKEALSPVAYRMFGERMVGYNRFYAAQGVNEQIDALIRVWRCPECRIGMYAVLAMSEYDGQYRITNVQHTLDDDGLKCTDITLSRVEENYDVTTET